MIYIFIIENGGNKISVDAADNYIPNENSIEISVNHPGTELQDGDIIKFDNYIIEYKQEVICDNPNSRSTTTTWSSISSYGVYNSTDSDEWYKVTQITNYTYDGTSVQINTENCLLNVKTYKSDCDYTVNINTVNNSSTTAPTYTIGLSIKLPLSWLTFIDTATVYVDGTTNLSHVEY